MSRDLVQIHLVPIANAVSANGPPFNRVGHTGWISSVVVNAHAVPSGLTAGRVYAQVRLLNSTGRIIAALWTGYVLEGSHPVSIPGLRVYDSDQISVRLWSNANAAVINGGVDCMIAIESEECSAGSIFSQVPGEGQPDVFVITVGNPGAGLDPGLPAVPTMETREWLGFGATLTTSAVAGNRKPKFTITDGTQEAAATDAGVSQVASTAVPYTGARGGGNGPSTPLPAVSLPIAQGRYPAGFIFKVSTKNLDAGDTWTGISGAIAFLIASWAVPE